MKKSNLIKGASLLLALAPAAVLASCGQSNNPIPSKFETVSVGSLCETKAGKGTTEYSIKVTLNYPGSIATYFTGAAVYRGEKFNTDNIVNTVDPLYISVVDERGYPIGINNDGIFAVNDPTVAYVTFHLKTQAGDFTLKDGEHLAALVSYVDKNKDETQSFNIDTADNGQWKVFSFDSNHGTPCIMPGDGLYNIDTEFDPIVFGEVADINNRGQLTTVPYFSYMEKRVALGSDFTYYRAMKKDEGQSVENKLEHPAHLNVLLKLKLNTHINPTLTFSSIIDVDLSNKLLSNTTELGYGENIYYRTILPKSPNGEHYRVFADAYCEHFIEEEGERGIFFCNKVFNAESGEIIPSQLDVMVNRGEEQPIFIEYLNDKASDVIIDSVFFGQAINKEVEPKGSVNDYEIKENHQSDVAGKSVIYTSNDESNPALFSIGGTGFDLNKPFNIVADFDKEGYNSDIRLVTEATLSVTYKNTLISSETEFTELVPLTYADFIEVPEVGEGLLTFHSEIYRHSIVEKLDTYVYQGGQNIEISNIDVLNINILYENETQGVAFSPTLTISWANI